MNRVRAAVAGRVARHWRQLTSIFALLPLHQQLVIAGVIVGTGAGLSVFLFETLLRVFAAVGAGIATNIPRRLAVPGIVLVPALGGLIAGLLTHWYCRDAKGHGVLNVGTAIHERGGYIEGRVSWVTALASAATIGSGGSAGREGPAAQIGAAIGSFLARRIGISGELLKTLVAGGAAGGVAASFSIPLAGVFFVIEVILRRFANAAFAAVVISSITATVVARLLLGSQGFLPALNYQWSRPQEFLFYALLGILCAPIGRIYRDALEGATTFFERRRGIAEWLRPALGGFMLGLLALALPEVRGTGREQVGLLLLGQNISWMLALLLVGKIVATAMTLGSGGSGGSLMPSLYIGAMAGGLYAYAWSQLLAEPLSAGAFAIVGMACVFAAAFNAPVTAIIMGFELSQDYGLLMPVMLACVFTYLFSRRAHEYTALAR